MEIQITQRFAQIGIDITQSQFRMNIGPADIQTRIIPARMDISVQSPRVFIDMTRPLEQMGLKGIVPFATEYAKKGKAAVLSGIARVAGEGDTLARSIGNDAAVIGRIARAKSFDKAQFNIGLIPRSAPEITAAGGLDLNVKQGDVQYDVTPRFPEIQFVPGNIRFYLRQTPFIKIETSGSIMDLVI
ncbi:DUF6470 family protein [Phosphitispora sp. TUW77]|uniref:DUF6470 family protein n=1 Tax=Phosphitispora sp. TUW77 TaxID=3152361 RepID=UPI003AB37606